MNIPEYLEAKRCQFQRMPHDPAFSSERMAHQLHVPGGEVAKTVLLSADNGYRYVVAVLPASKKLDLNRASSLLGGTTLRFARKHEITRIVPTANSESCLPLARATRCRQSRIRAWLKTRRSCLRAIRITRRFA